MDWVFLAIGLVGGAAAGALIAHSRAESKIASLTTEVKAKTESLAALEPLRAENDQLRVERARTDAEQTAAAERTQWVEKAQESLREAFAALASQALSSNAEQYLARARVELSSLLNQVRGDWGTHKEEMKGLVAPLEKSLTTLDGQIRTLEEKREGAYRSIEQQIRTLGDAQVQLQSTTTTLAQAMRSSTARGRWGELQLHRIVVLAGMEEHIDFDEQAVTDQGRPDMTIHLPNGGTIPIDAKAPADAYFEALKLDGDARKGKLAEHAKAMRSRVKQLASRQYGISDKSSAGLVVMFVPIESAVSAAYEEDEDLLEYGLDQKPRILIATPITLYALLRTAAFGWDQVRIAENMHAVVEDSRTLYDRLVKFLEHVWSIGKHLKGAADDYDEAVASWKKRLEPVAKRVKDQTASVKDLPEPETIDFRPTLPLDGAS